MRAVIVDDEPPARTRLRSLLEAEGVHVVGEAGSAIDARDVIRDARPDVVFLDVEMPEVRGTALAASLPEPRPFIVFATAYERYALDAIAVDATDYLLKPVSRAKLAATLERIRGRLARQSDLERDAVAGSAVQAQMWPGTLPVIAGFDCAAASMPARAVGGDFYDSFALDGATWGLLLGDASGKGIAAGLVASAVQARIHTAARLARLDPPALMAAVDRDVYQSIEGLRYATGIYATLEAPTGRLRLVNAGHPPVVALVPGATEALLLHSTGPALGLLPDGAFTAHDLMLSPGSVLVAYTDGVSEARNDLDEEFGDHLLAAVLADHRAKPAGELCSRILDAVRRHRGARQDQDDVTVMVIKADAHAGSPGQRRG